MPSLEGLLEEVLARSAAGTPGGAGTGAGPALGPGAVAEIRRLLRRKSELLSTGAYERHDPLIARIEARVAQLAGLPGPGAQGTPGPGALRA